MRNQTRLTPVKNVPFALKPLVPHAHGQPMEGGPLICSPDEGAQQGHCGSSNSPEQLHGGCASCQEVEMALVGIPKEGSRMNFLLPSNAAIHENAVMDE
jgi:hypothetical protein